MFSTDALSFIKAGIGVFHKNQTSTPSTALTP